MGGLLISGLDLPRSDKFDPLSKIWSSIRKRVMEQYGVDVVGLFLYDDFEKTVSCSFCLNYGLVEAGEVDKELYTQRFDQTFGM